jgi:PncC family amidohydrolase
MKKTAVFFFEKERPVGAREYFESENPFLDKLQSKRLAEVARVNSLSAAVALNETLSDRMLNIVTAESLTAGMIAKTLVDIPGMGATVYGGFIVYDTDAKRQFIDVKTRGVYNEEAAKQMAKGALERSRAMVAVGVSGDAMPFPDSKEQLGVVYIGAALRLKDGITTYAKTVHTCDRNTVTSACSAWKKLTRPGPPAEFAPFQFTSVIADYIRLRTVTEACHMIRGLIADEKLEWGFVDQKPYDSECEASWIIRENMYPPNPEEVSGCDPHDSDSL